MANDSKYGGTHNFAATVNDGSLAPWAFALLKVRCVKADLRSCAVENETR